MPRIDSAFPSIPSRPAAALLSVGAFALVAALALPASSARAGDLAAPVPVKPTPDKPMSGAPAPSESAASPSTEPAPRQAALDVAIHRLERHLAILRKARTELASNRPEPAATDDLARRRAELCQRGLREISRYEAARTRALAVPEGAASREPVANDAAKAALDALDAKFVDAMHKLEASLDDPAKAAPAKAPAKATAASDGKPTGDGKAGTDGPRPRRKAAKPAGAGSMSGGGAPDGEVADDDADEDDDTDRDE